MLNKVGAYSQYAYPQAAQPTKNNPLRAFVPTYDENGLRTSFKAELWEGARQFFIKFHEGQADVSGLELIFESTFKGLLKLRAGSNVEKKDCTEFKSAILTETLITLQNQHLMAVRHAQAAAGERIASKNPQPKFPFGNYFNSEFLFQMREMKAAILHIGQSFAEDNGLTNPIETEAIKSHRSFDDRESTRWVMNIIDFPDGFEPPRNFSIFHCRSGKLVISGTLVEMSIEEFMRRRTEEGLEDLAEQIGIELTHMLLAKLILQHIFELDKVFNIGHTPTHQQSLLEQAYRQHDFTF